MTSLATLVASYTRTPSATVYLDGKRWRGVLTLRVDHNFGDDYARGQVVGRDPPATPASGMSIRWSWGYNGYEEAAITGDVTRILDASYPDRYTLEVKDILWRAARTKSVIVVSPINDVAAKTAATYILTTYTTIPSGRIDLPALSASGTEMPGGVWTLGQLTPIQWGDTDTGSGKVSALKAVQDIYGALGYWVYSTRQGSVTAKQMDRRPASSAFRVFQRGDGTTSGTLLLEGAPERETNPDQVVNSVTVRGANTGVEGAQLVDTWRTDDTLLPSNIDQDREFSYGLLEFENESEAGVASVTGVAKRILRVLSRQPDIVRFRGKADPRIVVGTTIGVKDSGIRLSAQKNYFIYGYSRELDLQSGRFDDRYIADGGTGDQGYTTIPPPDAAFTWRLDTEGLNGDSVVAVFLDGSGSSSPTGLITSYAWTTGTTVYTGTSSSASGAQAVLFYLLSAGTAEITLTVTDTTSKTGSVTQTIDLTGADGAETIDETISGAAGAAWLVTQNGGLTWASETSNGDAIAVGTIGAGVDDRATAGSAATYGLLATRGSGGIGLRGTLDGLLTASTNLVAAGGAITSNIWINEANPARVWFAVGTSIYRSVDGGVTKTAMAAAPASVSWIMEDPALDNSIFLLAGANMYNATNPAVGYALLYEGPVGATARQFVRSRDGQVTWICYTGAPASEACQRVETGAAVDLPSVTDIRSIALDKDATSLRATLYLIDGDDPAAIYSCDGLTGLSVTTSTQTFPAGATVQHMLYSRQADLIYTADFDSVAVGTGAFRKYFPQADKLFPWLELDTGQQGHMLGLGARGESFRATILMLPSGASGAADKLWILDVTTAAWTGKALPAASKSDWQWIEANPFDYRKLLLFRYTGSGDNALYYSADFGDNWTTVFSNLTTDNDSTGKNVQWSLSFGQEWIMSRSFMTNERRLLRGNNATYAETTLSSGGEIFMGAGLNGDAVWLDIAGDVYVTDSAGATGSALPESLGNGFFFLLGGTRQMAHARTAAEHTVYVSDDYRSGGFTEIVGSSARSFLGILADGTIVCGGRSGSGVQEIADAWGTPSVSTVAFDSISIGAVATDKQTQTLAAAIYDFPNAGTLQPAVRDPSSGSWALLARPPDATDLANRIEVIEVSV